MKDAYYFPHFCNARHDRKIKRLRKELGVEGYGIFFMLLEVLRDQTDFRYPMNDLDLLADEIGTSESKVRVVICNYQLFDVEIIDNKQKFFSPKLLVYLQPYFTMKEQRSLAGKKSGEVRALTAKTPTEEKTELPQTYVIRCYNDKEQFIKIGSTVGTISRRFSGHLPYEYEVIRQIFSHDYVELEKELQSEFSEHCYKPNIKFAGDAECYKICIMPYIIDYKPTTKFSHERVFEHSLNENEQSKVKKSKVNKNKVNKIETHLECFESIWKLYPKKEGKGQVSETKKKELYKLGFEQIERCIERYKKAKVGTDKQFLQNGSTFFNSGYVDYLDCNYAEETSEVINNVPNGRNICVADEKWAREMGYIS